MNFLTINKSVFYQLLPVVLKDIFYCLQVSATDQDYGKNGEVTYSIRETNSQFTINSTGHISTNEAINRETLSSATIPVNVLATDGGNLQSTCSLLVQILDINDNAPVFENSHYDFTILNSRPVGYLAGTVVANDADIGNNGRVTYSFLNNTDGYFSFGATGQFTGSFTVNKTLPQQDTVSKIL